MALLTRISGALRKAVQLIFPKEAGRELAQIIDRAKAITHSGETHLPGYFTTIDASGAFTGAGISGTAILASASVTSPLFTCDGGGAGTVGMFSSGASALITATSTTQFAGFSVSGTEARISATAPSGQAVLVLGAAEGGASSYTQRIYTLTGLADNSATAVVTVTVPNANHTAMIRVTALGMVGSTDAFESAGVAEAIVLLTRTTGANVVAQVATVTLGGTAIATVSGGAALSAAPTIGVSSITGAVGATNTFTINLTVNDSGGVGSNKVILTADLINSEASGVTMTQAA